MRFPFPDFFDSWQNWAREFVLQAELPDQSPPSQDYYRLTKNQDVSSDTVLNRGAGIILADTSATSITLTLPPSNDDGWECEIVKVFPQNRVIIVPSGTDTLVGETSVEVYVQWTALRFRAVSDGYIIV